MQSVLQVLSENAVSYELRIFEGPAHRASQAADLLGCPLGAIVKSLVFEKQASGDLLMVLVSGKNRADSQILHQVLGEEVQPAKTKTILDLTGYPVGAVPPIGLKGAYPVIMDVDLMNYAYVWASAGTENMLMCLDPNALQRLTQARVEQITQKRG